ncbi:unnamed protein product [Ostreobium quekettii]|uniref:Uncharacterized protein n=1 Tax=Ostreobium quekettii TaxID=121088 RepID=A0A8S1ITJ6_9CHLO|nr:unnamed protein product [Ostreobium quekettii]
MICPLQGNTKKAALHPISPNLNAQSGSKTPPTEIADSILTSPWTSWFLDPEQRTHAAGEIALNRVGLGAAGPEEATACAADECLTWRAEEEILETGEDLSTQGMAGQPGLSESLMGPSEIAQGGGRPKGSRKAWGFSSSDQSLHHPPARMEEPKRRSVVMDFGHL